MAGYGQFCPVAKACEVIAERWTPLVVRELLDGSHRFNEIRRGVPLMSRSLLSKRLKELERAGVIERRKIPGQKIDEYHLTPAGEELRPIIEGIGTWGQRWVVREVESEDLDPSLLMWDIRRHLVPQAYPIAASSPLRVHRRQGAAPALVADGGRWRPDVCMTDPGFEVDVRISVSLHGLTSYWLGRSEWRELKRHGELRVEAPRWLERTLPDWLGRSSLAGIPAA